MDVGEEGVEWMASESPFIEEYIMKKKTDLKKLWNVVAEIKENTLDIDQSAISTLQHCNAPLIL